MSSETAAMDLALFDAFKQNLESQGVRRAMSKLVHDLAAQRSSLKLDTWKSWCNLAAGHDALNLLRQDPYSRDARSKPAGYAGDARTLDYVYLRDPGIQVLSSLGDELFRITTTVPIAEAVRNRSKRLASIIQDFLIAQDIVSVTSIACGHARELDHLPPQLIRRVQYWGLDQDSESIRVAERRFDHSKVQLNVGSIASILQCEIRIPESDLIYASGLFDYLNDRVAAPLLKRMFLAVRPGGQVVIANLTPNNDEIAYMEAVMDWWMRYRSVPDIEQLVSAVRLPANSARTNIYTTCDDRMVWLTLQKTA